MSSVNNVADQVHSTDDDDLHDLDSVPSKALNKNKLDAAQMALFGFNDVEDRKYSSKNDSIVDSSVGGGGHTAKKAAKKKSRSQNVVYGDVDDDDDDQGYVGDSASTVEKETGGETEAEYSYTTEETTWKSIGIDLEDFLWEDDEEDEELDEEALLEAEQSALFAAELERERIRNLRLIEIMKKKEDLIERYLKTGRIMISLRKKNIYLQDYLYHLAARKGVLRGDPQTHHQSVAASVDAANDEDATMSQIQLANTQKKKLQKKNTFMAVRFARFLKKTGHLFDEDQSGAFVHHHHHRHHKFQRQDHTDPLRSRLSRGFNVLRSQHNKVGGDNNAQHHHHHLVAIPLAQNRPNTCSGGKDCNSRVTTGKGGKTFKKSKDLRASVLLNQAYAVKKNRKRLTIGEILEKKAQTSIQAALKKTEEALEVMEIHRCKMKKRKQLIKIAELLAKQYGGIQILDQERRHLVHFVEHSVTLQNIAKRKALRRQQKNQSIEAKKIGVANVNHAWTKSLEKIRELRLKKAKLEKEQRLQLIKKVHHWNEWENKDKLAMNSVYDFIVKMGSKVIMSKRETESFNVGLEQFRKQLEILKEAMHTQLVKLFKAKSMLCMAQRRVKDDARVAATPAIKGFSMADFERMAIENQESHQKLLERQIHLVEQHEKLQQYVGHVATGHIAKQRTWGALRTGRHDLKQLWELCMVERDNLMKKFNDVRKVKRIHKRLFVQIAVLENKRLFKDYQRCFHKVENLKDKKRTMSTRLHQNTCNLRVLNVKMADTRRRLRETKHERDDKVLQDDMSFYKRTIQKRLHPTLPRTVYDVNSMRKSSMRRFLEPEIQEAIHTTVEKARKMSKPPPKLRPLVPVVSFTKQLKFSPEV